MGQSNVGLLPYSKGQKELLGKFVEVLLELPDIKKVVLFGSYARREQKAQSDFDILALTECAISREKRGELCSMFEEMGADLVFYTESQFSHSDCVLVQQIRRDGILLWQS